MASYGNPEIRWHNDQRTAASAAMDALIGDRGKTEVLILRWDQKNDDRPDRQVEAFRLIRLTGEEVA